MGTIDLYRSSDLYQRQPRSPRKNKQFIADYFSLFLLPAADAGVLACSKDNFCMRGLSNFYPDLTKRIRTSYQSKFYKGLTELNDSPVPLELERCKSPTPGLATRTPEAAPGFYRNEIPAVRQRNQVHHLPVKGSRKLSLPTDLKADLGTDCPDPSFLTFKNTKNIVPATIFTGANQLPCHTQVALSHNNHKVPTYKRNGSQWVKPHALQSTVETSQVGIGLSSMITLSWKDGVCTLTLVTLRINHAATFVKWSPLKNKFAVESEKQFISVCHLDIKMTSGGRKANQYAMEQQDAFWLTDRVWWHWRLGPWFNFSTTGSLNDHGCLTLVSKLDIPKHSIQHNMLAMEHFHNLDKNKQDDQKFCPIGINGAMMIWDFKTLESSTQGLQLI
ncbi:hypothetical protein E2I00_008397 [Balaenoptera physalus]|uniref:Uncharacterized protein n=1 Tax=Balaenoptera physalus TaxID=9770 RepID=A0A643BU28_BALPH|nr:hypothetical protein E2I00_008397 [Balaenoptera physalus]